MPVDVSTSVVIVDDAVVAGSDSTDGGAVEGVIGEAVVADPSDEESAHAATAINTEMPATTGVERRTEDDRRGRAMRSPYPTSRRQAPGAMQNTRPDAGDVDDDADDCVLHFASQDLDTRHGRPTLVHHNIDFAMLESPELI